MAEIQLIKRDGQARVQGGVPDHIFQDIYQNFLDSKDHSSTIIKKSYVIGGRKILVQFANQNLVPFIAPALDHLSTSSSSNPELVIAVWDKKLGGDLPKKLWEHATFEDTITDARLIYLLDHSRNLGLFWVADPKLIPYYEIGAPLRTIFHWWFQPRNYQILHSGAIGYADKAVLVVGKGGSGKSSTALACINAGLNYLGDDYTLVEFGGSPKIHSLYNTLKLNWDNLENFPNLPEPLKNTSGVQLEKAIFYVNQYKPDQVQNLMTLKAIMIPQITGNSVTIIKHGSSALAVAALAPSTVFQLSGHGEITFQHVSKLCKLVPTYTLALGNDFTEIPKKIKEHIKNG